MKTLRIKIILAGVVALSIAFCAVAQSGKAKPAPTVAAVDQPDAGNLRTFFELARSDLKTQKALVIAQNLPLTEVEAAEFWPLHHDYEAELTKLNDRKLALIVRYADLYNKSDAMTDQEATELAEGSFDVEAKKTDLKRKYFKKFSKVVPATKAARFFQIENQINTALDLRVAASLPLIK
jgi:hypothetical protein